MSNVSKEVASVLGITLKRATTKLAQTIGFLERSHASIKQALKIETGERRWLWRKYVNIAVLNYNTSYHTSIGCEPSRIFHILYETWRRFLAHWSQRCHLKKDPKDSSGFFVSIKCGVVCCCVGCLPAFNGTHIHWGRRNWRRYG